MCVSVCMCVCVRVCEYASVCVSMSLCVSEGEHALILPTIPVLLVFYRLQRLLDSKRSFLERY